MEDVEDMWDVEDIVSDNDSNEDSSLLVLGDATMKDKGKDVTPKERTA